MGINASGLYAISTLAILARSTELMSGRTICRGTDMPDRFVAQILTRLAKARIVTSVRGKFGGYRLAKPVSKITLLEVFDAVGALPSAEVDRLDGLSKSEQSALDSAFSVANEAMRKRLGAVTLSLIVSSRK